MVAPDLTAAATAVERAKAVVDGAARHVAAHGGIDANQTVAYDLAHAAAAVESARAVLDYGAKGDLEGRIACAFAADAVFDVVTKALTREAAWGAESGSLDATFDFVRTYRAPDVLASL